MRHLSLSVVGRPELRQTDWVQFLYPFTNLQTLCLLGSCPLRVAPALKNVEKDMGDEFLPALDLIYVELYPMSLIAGFCRVRQLSGRPISVVGTQKEFDERFKSYPREQGVSSGNRVGYTRFSSKLCNNTCIHTYVTTDWTCTANSSAES